MPTLKHLDTNWSKDKKIARVIFAVDGDKRKRLEKIVKADGTPVKERVYRS